jgi:hypothetical protein
MAKIKFRTMCITSTHGTFTEGDIFSCSDEMAKHFVVDCMAADYYTPPTVAEELAESPADPRIEAAIEAMEAPEVAPKRRGRPPKVAE